MSHWREIVAVGFGVSMVVLAFKSDKIQASELLNKSIDYVSNFIFSKEQKTQELEEK